MNTNNKENRKRLFFGMEVFAPWPQSLPSGRMVGNVFRHLTLNFLGDTDFANLAPLLETSFPKPNFQVGLTGFFDQPLFLPKRHPHVVSWHVKWLDNAEPLISYQKECTDWLHRHGFGLPKKDELLPHVTICRSPFEENEWKKSFTPIPMMVKDIHLYESKVLGELKYESIWSHSLLAPFEEMEHTADVGFKILGENIYQLHSHAQVALAFIFPAILPFLPSNRELNSLEDIVIDLNQTISIADGTIGCPFKAVSFHGDLKETEQKILNWEMIIDV